MTTTHTSAPSGRRRLRLWPGIFAAALIVATRFIVPLVMTESAMYEIVGPLAGSAIVLLWWLFFSRAAWVERLGALVVIAIAAIATTYIVDPSIAGGLQRLLLFLYAFPATVPLALVLWAATTRRMSDPIRRVTMVAALALGCAVWALVRTSGVSSERVVDLHWRWTPTSEERLLAQEPDLPQPGPAAAATSVEPAGPGPEKPAAAPGKPIDSPAVAAPPTASDPAAAKRDVAWPGFRGARRDAVVSGARIDTHWSASPPVELWRRPVGPGWSSFAVGGGLVYTQEQRGEEEVVSCYRLDTGRPVWRHGDRVRFYESNGGAGPRATPAVHDGRVYTLGATGILNALDARSGAVAWARNAATDTGEPIPGWGFAGSPLVVDDAVIVATSGRLASYDSATGRPRWTHTTGGSGYSSPHLVTIDGVAQVVLLTSDGATSVAPADGRRLWEHTWKAGAAIVQPGLSAEGDILLGLGDSMGGQGMRRLAVTRAADGWAVEERWTTRGLKPYFNDFVVHEGHAFGFDGTILACIDLADGARKWKGGRYGQGQMLLLPEQDLLLVISEDGELALVSATPGQYSEIARFKAVEGKTWNHPVLVGDVLLVRNAQEMVAFRLR